MTFEPIGVVHSPFKTIEEMPIQPAGADAVAGTIEIRPDLVEGLRDLDGFSHLFVIYHFHQVRQTQLTVTPFLDTRPHGVFATRAPKRPNPIGLSVVRLAGIEGNLLHIENLDMLEGTPVLDIKPFVPEFDQPEQVRTGWLEAARGRVLNQKSDRRFE
ncbi:tRNA (N6-threonylcarbamoyladenosine(37)-N6)-methyltransferase TrmO [Desulfuromonas versatilis]|uniref:tRNA (N6-threonylcarbamoyladenosine(37)-N6)-methyltransferase TrmO n=1 Tax=Desulfuromonas versatilis TaxID=2802975 RepID=A0ABM8HZM6_9BACT|nr:tRNA (N6-threonylcarbamoyladenosine(37)-N6)-methyltransferase TrmO [Desulfuromonas versatilis]BCR06154.1 tRNA (N6-threonylcarbamoyladenosine(37)-N6)-methyltransferase TrmO [Desulfuromonas versatilis]